MHAKDVVSRGEVKVTLMNNYLRVTLDGQMKVSSEVDLMFNFPRKFYIGMNRVANMDSYNYSRWGSGMCGLKVKFISKSLSF